MMSINRRFKQRKKIRQRLLFDKIGGGPIYGDYCISFVDGGGLQNFNEIIMRIMHLKMYFLKKFESLKVSLSYGFITITVRDALVTIKHRSIITVHRFDAVNDQTDQSVSRTQIETVNW